MHWHKRQTVDESFTFRLQTKGVSLKKHPNISLTKTKYPQASTKSFYISDDWLRRTKNKKLFYIWLQQHWELLGNWWWRLKTAWGLRDSNPSQYAYQNGCISKQKLRPSWLKKQQDEMWICFQLEWENFDLAWIQSLKKNNWRW
jgi:hypothetical protein